MKDTCDLIKVASIFTIAPCWLWSRGSMHTEPPSHVKLVETSRWRVGQDILRHSQLPAHPGHFHSRSSLGRLYVALLRTFPAVLLFNFQQPRDRCNLCLSRKCREVKLPFLLSINLELPCLIIHAIGEQDLFTNKQGVGWAADQNFTIIAIV